MIDETMTAVSADAEAVTRRATLEAEAVKRSIKFDKRFSDKRISDLIAEHDAKLAAPTAATTSPAESDLAAQLEALRRENEALKAKAAAPKSSVPPGTLTTMDMAAPGTLGRQDEERKLLMEQAARLGIARDIRPGLNNDGIRERITAKMAEQAAMQAVVDEQERLRAAKPVEAKVTIRVLPLGDKKISKGVHIPGVGDMKFSYGDHIPDVPLSTAKQHQANGFAEIVAG